MAKTNIKGNPNQCGKIFRKITHMKKNLKKSLTNVKLASDFYELIMYLNHFMENGIFPFSHTTHSKLAHN